MVMSVSQGQSPDPEPGVDTEFLQSAYQRWVGSAHPSEFTLQVSSRASFSRSPCSHSVIMSYLHACMQLHVCAPLPVLRAQSLCTCTCI